MDKPTIMVVDDDADVREAVANLLERNGYVVLPASNGQEALDELHGRAERPSLILLDLMMPVMDGRAFYEEQQADPELRDIPVVAFTSFPGALEGMNGIQSLERLDKPMEAEQLLDSVHRWSEPSNSNSKPN
jgi:CheY-like chemotaxis protein